MPLNPHAIGDAGSRRAIIAADLDRQLGSLERRIGNARASQLVAGQDAVSGSGWQSINGPSVTMRVPEYGGAGGRGFISVTFQMDTSFPSGIDVALFEIGVFAGVVLPLATLTSGGGWTTVYTVQPVVFGAGTGIKTFEVQYSAPGGTVQVRNRLLAVESL